MSLFKKILVPSDFSEDAEAALDLAIQIAQDMGAELHLVHAYRLPVEMLSPYGVPLPDAVVPEIRKAAGGQLQEQLDRVRRSGVQAEAHLREGTAPEAVAEAARALGADLIVMGTRGRTGLAHVVLGSVAERTLRAAPCPVLTVKAGKD